MLDVIGAKNQPRELRRVIIFFVGGVVGPDYADLPAAILDLLEPASHQFQRLAPGGLFELPVFADQRRLQPLGMMREVECVASLDAQELAVDARPVAVVAANDLVITNAQRGLAAVRAGCADSAHVL